MADLDDAMHRSTADARARALEHDLGRLWRLMDSVPCALIRTDAAGRIASVNRGAVLLFECGAGVLVGSSLFERVEATMLAEFLRQAKGTALRSTCTGKARTMKGNAVPIEIMIDAHPDDEHLWVIITSSEGTDRQRFRRDVLDLRERERRRIGRDLHDSLGQQMVGLGMLVRNLARCLDECDPELAETAERAVEIIDGMVTHTRDLARGLYPVELETKGLVQALRALVNQTARHTGVRIELRVQEKRPLAIDMECASQLFRIAQEALSNAVRHARPQSILVHLRSDDKGIELAVVDDGVGLPPSAAQVEGMGFRMMAERANAIGAVLTLGSDSGGGATVRCVVPLGPHAG